MKNLRYICVQPRLVYYAWQVEVMINNLIKHGVNANKLEILVAWNPKDDTNTPEVIEMWDKLRNHYNYVRFFYYEDTRENPTYIPSIYFNILKQHIKAFPELQDEALYLFDCDTILTRPLDLTDMLYGDNWYLSDTVGYIGYQYIKTKVKDGYDVYNGMCNIVGIDPLIPKLLNSHSGGAQHLVKNTTYEYWDKVEKDAETMYRYFCKIENDYPKENEHDYPIQKWTAGMWSLLWNAWLFEHVTLVDGRLDFCWATDPIKYWDERSIYHNAGVTCNCGYFYKGDYIRELPYNKQVNVKAKYCSYNYYKEIQETALKSCLI